MGAIQDILQEVPLAAVLRERVALAEQKYEAAVREVEALKTKVAALERENAALRSRIPRDKGAPLSKETELVLIQIFKAREIEDRDVDNMATALGMDRGVMQYHLDRLNEAGLAHKTASDIEGVYWALKPEGRRYVVERNLHR
jgi:DNA-binding transcriptional ArsR family regulator